MMGKSITKVAVFTFASLFALQACDSMGSLDKEDRKELAQLDRLGAFVTRYPNMPKEFVDLNAFTAQINKLAGYRIYSAYSNSDNQRVSWDKTSLKSSGGLDARTCDADDNKVAIVSYSGYTSGSDILSTIRVLKGQGVLEDDNVRENRGQAFAKRIRHPFYYGYEQEVKRGDIKQVTISGVISQGYDGKLEEQGRISYSIEYSCGEE